MWSDNALSTYLVMFLAVWMGNLAKGVTGFGSAIIILCAWIAFSCAGVFSGTLQQAVVVTGLSDALLAPAMCYISRAHKTADMRLAATLVVFTGLGSPIGASLLVQLHQSTVQIVMGFAVLSIIVLEQSTRLALFVHSRRKLQLQQVPSLTQPLLEALPEPEAGAAADEQCSCTQGTLGPGDAAHLLPAPSPSSASIDSSADCVLQIDDDDPLACPTEQQVTVKVWPEPQDANSCESSSNVSQQQGQAAWRADSKQQEQLLAASAGASRERLQESDQLMQPQPPLLEDPLSVSSSASSRSNLATDGQGGDGGSGSNSCRSRLCCCAAPWLKTLAAGAVAGLLCGVMGSLTGAGGPPLMILYRALDTSKQVVRGTNAVLNVCSLKIFFYFYLGLIRKADAQLYIVACIAGALGVVAGDAMAGRMNQRVFQQVLLLLMVLCAGLMFASGFGLMSN